MPRPEFSYFTLNSEGRRKASRIADLFTDTLDELEILCGSGGREMALVRTKLEEASFYAKKAVALRPDSQE